MLRPTPALIQSAASLALLAGCAVTPAAPATPTLQTATPVQAPTATASPPPPTAPATPTFTPTAPPTPEGRVTRGPYLQSAASDSIVIVWETDRSMPGEVLYGRSGVDAQRVASSSDGLRHEVVLEGLEPGTPYEYQVASNGYPMSVPAAFRTAPIDPGAAFTFVAYGDTRTGHEDHRQIAAQILDRRPDFAVHTGDLVTYGFYDSEWDTFFEIERPLLANVPLFPSPGNHDANDPRYFGAFVLPGNERWYSFDWVNARIICLQIDAIVPFGTDSEQVRWLESMLAGNTQEWLIVVFHIPPWDAVEDEVMNQAVRINLVPLLERYAVDLVLNGDSHNYQRSSVNGVTYIVTAGAGAELYTIQRPGPYTDAYYNGHHFVEFAIQGSALTGTVWAEDGAIVDTFSLQSDDSTH